MTTEDIVAIEQVIARYGHVVDRHIDQMATVFTSDVVFDTTPAGGTVVHGIAAILLSFTGSAAPPAGVDLDAPQRPGLSHYTMNVEVLAVVDECARARSKFLRVGGGAARTGTYMDDLRRTDDGWRIARRVVLPHG